MTLKFIYSSMLLLSSFLMISSCAPAMFTGFAVSTYTVAKDNSLNQTANDLRIANFIRANLFKNGLSRRVSVEVLGGRVLCVGYLLRDTDVTKVLNIAWEQRGVIEVINELVVEQENSSTTVVDYTQDSFITATIKSSLLADREIRSVNYIVMTVRRVVYILGQAHSEYELKKVAELAARIKGVRKVIDHSTVLEK